MPKPGNDRQGLSQPLPSPALPDALGSEIAMSLPSRSRRRATSPAMSLEGCGHGSSDGRGGSADDGGNRYANGTRICGGSGALVESTQMSAPRETGQVIHHVAIVQPPT